MSVEIIITLCSLLLLAYLFDISSSKTRVPSVILLLLLGYGVNQLIQLLELSIPNLSSALPVLGTVGLILIVLEGALELEINQSKYKLIFKAALSALVALLGLSFGIAYTFQYFTHVTLPVALANAIPLAIISSAIAIPSVHHLMKTEKEFVIYESSLSDIFGVIFFNFITLNDNFGTQSFATFSIQIVVMLLLSFAASVGLAYLLSKIQFHIKFVPIILLTILVYSIAKYFHLPSLIFILLFGVFLGNLDELSRFKWIQRLQPDILQKEVDRFKEIVLEMTFLIRALFFLIFGFSIRTADVINTQSLIWTVSICASIFIIRFISLKLLRIQSSTIAFIAPRGLITILLFLSLPESYKMEFVDQSLILQTVLISVLIMMFGLIRNKKVKEDIPSS